MVVLYNKNIVKEFGSGRNARRVTFTALPIWAQLALRRGDEVRLSLCPDGLTRRIVRIGKRYYTRLV